MGKEKIPEEGTVDADRLWSTLDGIRDGLNDLTNAFTKFQENVEGRLNRMDEKHDETRAELDHARESRGKAFARIDKLSDDTRDRFHEFEHRLDELRVAPALEAFADNRSIRGSVKDEIVRNLARGAIYLILILVLLAGGHYVLNSSIAALLPKEIPVEVIDNEQDSGR